MKDRRSHDMSMFRSFVDMSAEYVDGVDIFHPVGVNLFDASKLRGMTVRGLRNGGQNGAGAARSASR